MALSQEVKDAVEYIVENVAPTQTGELATLFQTRIMDVHSPADLQIIDTQLMEAGFVITPEPVCRKKLPM